MNLENKLMKMQSTRIALKRTQKEIYTITKDKALTTKKATLCIPYKINDQVSYVPSTEMLNWHSFLFKKLLL